MKLFISILVSLIIFATSVNAQLAKDKRDLLIQLFPNATPEFVVKEAKLQPVDEDFIKKQKNKSYQYLATSYKLGVLKGDTVLVYDNQPFYSLNQSSFMFPVIEQKVKKAPKQKRAPRTAEQKQQDQQMVSQGVNILTNIILPTVLKRNNVSYAGSNWGGASLPTGRN